MTILTARPQLDLAALDPDIRALFLSDHPADKALVPILEHHLIVLQHEGPEGYAHYRDHLRDPGQPRSPAPTPSPLSPTVEGQAGDYGYRLVLARAEQLGLRIVSRRGYSMVQCPVHDDRDPSLQISPGASAPVALRCHAGCQADQIMLRFGLTWADLHPSDTRAVTSLVSTHPKGWLGSVWDRYERGELTPVWIQPAEIPNASEAARRLLGDVLLLIGLARAEGCPLPVPYSVRFACERVGKDPHDPTAQTQVRRALAQLVKAGALSEGLPLRRRQGMRYGTKTYAEPITNAGS